jgi:hypothetical protein
VPFTVAEITKAGRDATGMGHRLAFPGKLRMASIVGSLPLDSVEVKKVSPGVSSGLGCHVQDGFARELPVEELASHPADLGPGGLHADRRFEPSCSDQAGQV